MDLSHKFARLLCAEPLEGRWLLSSAAPSEAADPVTPAANSVAIEWEPVEEEEEDGDVIISTSDLPKQVLAAFKSEHPRADITEVELEEEDQSEYGITAKEEDGTIIDVTLSADGEILETETFISATEVPQAVLDAIQQKYPGATIEEAARITSNDAGDGFEVLITDAKGNEWEGETSFTPSSTPPSEETPPTPDAPAVPPSTPFAAAPPSEPAGEAESPPDNAAAATPAEEQAVAQAPSTGSAETASREDVIEKNAAAAAAARATTFPAGSDRISGALNDLAAGTGATVWLPELAGTLLDVLPINIDAMEQQLKNVLNQFGSIGGTVKSESAVSTGISRIAMAATLVAAVKVLLNHSRKSKATAPAVVFGPGDATWGWVLGTTVPKRRRRVTSRQRVP